MFQVTTMDLNNIPKNEDGTVDYKQDFFGKPTNLTVSGQLNAGPTQWHSATYILSDLPSVQRTPTPPVMQLSSG